MTNLGSALPSSEHRGLLLVLSGPSGVGKTTLAGRLVNRSASQQVPVVRSVSVTTRPRRPKEVDGTDYHFVSDAQFTELLTRGDLLEHAEIYGHRYGTPRLMVESHLRAGTDVVLVLDGQGWQQVAASCPRDVVSVFLLPPSPRELERRLRDRATEREEDWKKRLDAAAAEIRLARKYDHVLVNDVPDTTLIAIDAIRHAEHQRRREPKPCCEPTAA